MMAPYPSDDRTSALGLRDGATIMLVLALGAAGYLCDAHSPLVQPLLPWFGLFFAGAGAALLGICVYQAARHRQTGWSAGMMFGLFPVIGGLTLLAVALLVGLVGATRIAP